MCFSRHTKGHGLCLLVSVSNLLLQGGFFKYLCFFLQSCMRFSKCCVSGRYLQLYMTVVSWFVEFLGCLVLVTFFLGNGGIDVTAFNFAPFRNLTCDESFSLLGTLRHSLSGFPLIACKLNPVWTRGATCAVLFHFPAHLLFFISVISNFL